MDATDIRLALHVRGKLLTTADELDCGRSESTVVQVLDAETFSSWSCGVQPKTLSGVNCSGTDNCDAAELNAESTSRSVESEN